MRAHPKDNPLAYATESYRPEGKVNLLACMSLEGVIAPWTKVAPSTRGWSEHILTPQLRPGQILVLDNYLGHKALVVRELLQQRDCKLLFLPNYSPDFNPVELLFAKLKARLKQISATTLDALSSAIQQTLMQVSLADLFGWFRHAGYLVY